MTSYLQSQQFADQHRAWLRETIRRFGWAIEDVFGDEHKPPFAYTVGLLGFDHPELVVVGLSPAAGLLNELGEMVRTGHRFQPGERFVHSRVGLPLQLLEVDDSSQTLLASNETYRLPDAAPVPALQVVWSDRTGHFPWDTGYSVPLHLQPVLGPCPGPPSLVPRRPGLAFDEGS